MSTHNVGFYEELTKIICQLSSNTRPISSSVCKKEQVQHTISISGQFLFYFFFLIFLFIALAMCDRLHDVETKDSPWYSLRSITTDVIMLLV